MTKRRALTTLRLMLAVMPMILVDCDCSAQNPENRLTAPKVRTETKTRARRALSASLER